MELLDSIFGKNPNAKKVADGYLLTDGTSTIHVFDVLTQEDTEGLSQQETAYLPFCSRNDILEIRNQKTSDDYLLWLRAEAISGAPRAVRVFRKRMRSTKNWDLTTYYQAMFPVNQLYIDSVGKNYKSKIQSLPAGMVLLQDVNAMCIKTPFGNIVVVSEALAFFLYFMNIAFLGHALDIDSDDIAAALAIALRIMLGSESLDFDLDPRGQLPPFFDENIRNHVNYQLLFVIGHEYAHHTLNHLATAKTNITTLSDVSFSCSQNKLEFYRYKYKQEFDADLYAIKNIKNNGELRSSLLDSAVLLFIYFDILDHVKSVLALKSGASMTHPKPIDRIWHLRKKIKSGIGANSKVIEANLERGAKIKNLLTTDWLPYHIDDIETYGSKYLPSYKKTILRDRIDF